MRSYHGKRLPNQGEAQMGVPTLGINMYNSDSEVGENYLSSAINAYAHKNECVVLDPGAVYDPLIDMLFPALDITGEALTADIVLNGSTTYLVMLRRNTDGTLSILSLDVHNKTVVHNVSVASTWSAPSADFVCYSTIARTPAEIKVVFSSPEYNDIIFYDFTATPEIYTLVFKPKRMTTHLNRLFAIDTSMALWWSGAGQYTNWYGDVFPDNYILEDAGVWPIATESLLSDIAVFNNNLYVFAPNNIYIFRGTDYSSFSLELILTNFGVSPNHDYNRVYSTKGYLYFIYRDAIYEFNGDSYPTIISRPVVVAGQVSNGIGGGIPRLPQGTFFDGSLWADDSRLFFHLGREYYQFDIQERTWWRSAGFALGNEFSGTNDVRQLFFYNFTTNRTDCVVSSIDGANSKLAAFKRLYMDINTAHLETKAFNSMPSHDHTLTNIIIEYKSHIDNEEEYIQIWTADDFYGVRDNLDGNYIIMDDIDIEDWSGWEDFPDFPDWDFEYNWPDPLLWPKIGTPENPFTGTFISNGFTINGWELEYHPGTIINGTMTVWVDSEGDRLPNPFFYSYWTYPQPGDGSIDNPYEIWTASDLNNVRGDYYGCYIQMSDIDLATWGNWLSIANDNEPNYFSGSYDGNGFGIYNMTSVGVGSSSENAGLFGEALSASFKNITMYNPVIIGNTNSGFIVGYLDDDTFISVIDNCHVINGNALNDDDSANGSGVGGIIGYAWNSYYGTAYIGIYNCTFSGNINSKSWNVGGIIGETYSKVFIENCSVNKYSASDSITGHMYVGGLLGYIDGNTSYVVFPQVDYCYANIDVNGVYPAGNIRKYSSQIGGLIGWGIGNIKNSYYIGNVIATALDGTDANEIAGFIGGATYAKNLNVENCYSVATVTVPDGATYFHPFLGIYNSNADVVSNCYYNYNLSSDYDPIEFDTAEKVLASGTPKSTAYMMLEETYEDWDFDSIWVIDPLINDGYPYLKIGRGIEVWTAEDLFNVRDNLTGDYIQMADIDLSGYSNWRSIADLGEAFRGSYDGNGYKIYNLSQSSEESSGYGGLFAQADKAEFKNISIINANIDMDYSTSSSYIGGIVGVCYRPSISSTSHVDSDKTKIYNCFVSGVVSSVGGSVGGIIGEARLVNIKNCGSRITASGDDVGGIAGVLQFGEIEDCYSVSTIQGVISSGGICGSSGGIAIIGISYSWSFPPVIEDCYSASVVTGTSPRAIVNPYPVEYGANEPLTKQPTTISGTYYDSDVYESNTDTDGDAKTTAEMKLEATFIDWDFNRVWGLSAAVNNGYPYLRRVVL